MSDERAHPSMLNRVARRLSRLRRTAESGLEAIRREASHPGQPGPPPGGADAASQVPDRAGVARAAPSAAYHPGGDPTVDPLARPVRDGAAGDDAWYLQGEYQGWDQTDPSPVQDPTEEDA